MMINEERLKEKDEAVWSNAQGNKYKLNEIDDRYLENIIAFISKGGGSATFLTNTKIRKLFQEANKRKIKHNHKLKDLISAFQEKKHIKNSKKQLVF